jgi:hypothetical protein
MSTEDTAATIIDYPGFDHQTGRNVPGYIRDGQGVTWTPHIGAFGDVGFRVEHPNGAVRYVLLVPSADDTNGTSNVFLYESTEPSETVTGDPVTYLAPFGEGNTETEEV